MSLKKILGRIVYLIGGILPHGTYRQFPISQAIRRCAGKLIFDKAGKCLNIGRKCRLSNHICMGNRSSLGDYSYVSGSLSIGDDVMIAPWCVFIGLNHIFDENTLAHKGAEDKPITIGNHAWIGYGAKILAGVDVGEYAIVGAGAVVTKNVAPYSIVAGVPAREIKKRKNEV